MDWYQKHYTIFAFTNINIIMRPENVYSMKPINHQNNSKYYNKGPTHIP